MISIPFEDVIIAFSQADRRTIPRLRRRRLDVSGFVAIPPMRHLRPGDAGLRVHPTATNAQGVAGPVGGPGGPGNSMVVVLSEIHG